MALNPGISLQAQTPQFGGNRLQQLAQMQQLEAGRDRQRLTDLQIRGAERESEENRLLSEALRDSGGDLDKAATTAMQRGAVRGGLGLQKSAAEARAAQQQALKSTADVEKTRLETNMARVNATSQILASARDQATYDAARQQLAALPGGAEAVQRMPAQFNPQFITQTVQQGMTLAQRMEQDWKAKGYDLDVRKAGETERSNRATEGIAGRNASAREAEVAMGGKPPPGYRWGQGGALEFIPGGPGDPKRQPLNESQAGAGVYAGRMGEANALLDQIAGRGTVRPSVVKQAAESVPVIGPALGMAANAAASPDQQSVEQAQRDFINATLRRESGAAISPSEFQNARQQYFPQVGDSEQVIAQKRANRMRAQQSMMAVVPEHARGQFSGAAGLPASTQGGAVPPASGASTSPGINPADPLGLFGPGGR